MDQMIKMKLLSSYLKAVASARAGDNDAMIKNLKAATSKDAMLKR